MIGQNSSIVPTSLFGPSSIETGRSEKGEESNQEFEYSNDSFNSWTSNTVHIQILPESQKPVEVKEIRNYCTNCGTRHKKSSWKFCPNCGTKI
jgi:membrane protease subunit (stomatin/prohibitin family)